MPAARLGSAASARPPCDRAVRALLGVSDHRVLDNHTPEEKAHSLDRIAELLNPPLRVTHLEEMLDTIASAR